MHMSEPFEHGLVSVIICVYNAGEYLRSSVASVLNQTYRDLEVIVVDDGSTDGCMSALDNIVDPRLRIIGRPNGGKPVALNQALDCMRGEFYAVHDADDLSHSRRIECQVQCMRDHPDVAGVFCGYDLILSDRHVAPIFSEKNQARCRRDIESMHMPGHDPTAMYRTCMVQDLRYDEQLPIVEGYDYVLRVGETWPMYVVGRCLYSYRIHWNTVTKRNPERRQKLLMAARRKVLERRGVIDGEINDPAKAVAAPAGKRNRDLDNDIVSHFMASTVDLLHAGRRREAMRYAAACAMLHPLDPYYFKPVIYSVAPVGVVDRYRAWKGTL